MGAAVQTTMLRSAFGVMGYISAENMRHAQLITVHQLGHGGVLDDKAVIEQSVSFLMGQA